MSLPAKLLAVLLALAAAFAAGWVRSDKHRDGIEAKKALAASEQARKTEQDNARSRITAMDNYSITAQAEKLRALDARSDRVSVQHSLAAIARAAPASGCEPDPRVRILADLLAEGAGLAEEGAGHVADLRAQKRALIEGK